MSTDTERLEHEAEAHRAGVDSALDQLKERFSIGQIVDEFASYAKEGQGADAARNLGRQLRDNPVAIGLVGAGLAWFLMGDSMRSGGDRLRHRYDDWRHRGEDDDYYYEAGYPEDVATGYAARGGGTRAGRPVGYPVGPNVGVAGPDRRGIGTDDSPGFADRARGAAASAGGSIRSGASHAGSAASHAGHSAADAARRAGSSVSSAGHRASDAMWRAERAAERRLHDARDAFYSGASRAYSGANRVGRGAGRYGRRAQRGFFDTLDEQPLVLGAVAVALGAAIGAAFPSTRREDEFMGGTRDRLRDEAYDYGRDAMHRAEHVAEEAYRAGSEEAERQGLKPSGEGETIAEKVSHVAETAAKTAKDEAKKEGMS